NLPTLYKNQTYKTIIIYSAAIVESLLHYKLKSLIESGRVRESKIFKKEFKYDELSKVILNDELGVDLPIVLCKKADIEKHLKDNTQFHDMIIAGKRCRLLTPTLFKYCNEIKDLRNNIHMASMMEVDDKYTKVKVNNIYRKVKKVIDRIESY
ncbi:hypothetical protein KC909_05415, partial [Candidatus Dojkabacteria bacterium]|nr:hypothetical protein [Candidatus Dojkabacteria bacterium]